MSLELYVWTTPNGYKPIILLEELGIEYNINWVNIQKGEQFEPSFLKISPNNKIPALVDRKTDTSVFESAALLIYLAETYQGDKNFLPTQGADRYAVLQWVMFQMASIGPMMGQAYHFKNLDEQIPYANERFGKEVMRLYGVMEKQLESNAYIAGDHYSIADMLLYPWVRHISVLGIDETTHPNFVRWLNTLNQRPAIKNAMAKKPNA